MDNFIKIIIIVLISFIPTNNCYKFSDSCALKACKNLDPDKINVHLIPHSHNDLGWLKTVEDYFVGENNKIHNAGVQYVLDSVLEALKRNNDRRYIQVETAYFYEWWKKQSKVHQDVFRNFVNNGVIEMVGGGWSMNDEACVSYQSTINQFTWGLRILNDTLGECGRPRIGWQIDPFGHSREQAAIFKQMGYEGIFLTRIGAEERTTRKLGAELELMWRSSDDFDDSDIFTSIMDSYYAPSDFCWDYLECNSDAINDDPESFDYNLDKKVKEFADHIANYSTYFKTNNILYAMGGDFQYQAAEINYLNMDKLIKGFENHPDYNVFYSTPSCYVQAVKSKHPPLYVKQSGDFFPYDQNPHTYWSGYYTSRSTLKRFERTANNILQAAQQINAFAKIKKIVTSEEAEENLRSLREAVGIMQHHDAITGTEKEHVAQDYVRILTAAISKTEENIGNILGNVIKVDGITEDIKLPLFSCLLSNISYCNNSMKDRSLIAIYNPLPRFVTYYIRLPVQNAQYRFQGVYGDVNFELVKHMKYPVKSPYDSSDIELMATDSIPPMGVKLYYLEKIGNNSTVIQHKAVTHQKEVTLEKANMKLVLNTKTGQQTLTTSQGTYQIQQEYMYYDSNNGTGDNISSGAYVFRPVNGTAAKSAEFKNFEVMHLKGTFNDEIIMKINDYIIQTMRLRAEDTNTENIEYVEYDWVIGPLDNKTVDTNNNIGKEVIVRYFIEDMNNMVFFTDSNGRQMIERKRNNNLYNDTTKEAVSSNYYPVTSRLMYIDYLNDTQLNIITDRPQGGTSLTSGQLELMLHRRTLVDDHKGVGESLEEMEYDNYIITRGQHYLTANTLSTFKTEKILTLNKLTQPWMLVADATSPDMTYENLKKKINFKWYGLTTNGGNGLPPYINVLNFEPWKDNTYLFRLEHTFASGDDKKYGKKTWLELKYIFSPSVISSILELSLGANEFISTSTIDGPNYNVTLKPMEIRTFLITFKDQ